MIRSDVVYINLSIAAGDRRYVPIDIDITDLVILPRFEEEYAEKFKYFTIPSSSYGIGYGIRGNRILVSAINDALGNAYYNGFRDPNRICRPRNKPSVSGGLLAEFGKMVPDLYTQHAEFMNTLFKLFPSAMSGKILDNLDVDHKKQLVIREAIYGRDESFSPDVLTFMEKCRFVNSVLKTTNKEKQD